MNVWRKLKKANVLNGAMTSKQTIKKQADNLDLRKNDMLTYHTDFACV